MHIKPNRKKKYVFLKNKPKQSTNLNVKQTNINIFIVKPSSIYLNVNMKQIIILLLLPVSLGLSNRLRRLVRSPFYCFLFFKIKNLKNLKSNAFIFDTEQMQYSQSTDEEPTITKQHTSIDRKQYRHS